MDKDELVKFCRSATIVKTRSDKESFTCFNEETEFKEHWEAIKDLLFKEGFEIRDFYYACFGEALDDIGGKLKRGLTLDEIRESLLDDLEADIYTSELLAWLSEDLNNLYLCDEVIKECGLKEMTQIISYAQVRQKEEIYAMAFKVVEYLSELED